MRVWLYKLCCAVTCVWFCGCSVFTHYTSRLVPVRETLTAGDPQAALGVLEKNRLNAASDKLCYLFEEGTLKHVASEYEESNKVFFEAGDVIEDRDMRAVISIGKSAEQFGSILVNEKTLAYEGEGYERVLMHTLQAINFVMLGDPEAARVEIKKAYQEALDVEEMNRKKLEKVEDQMQYENEKRPRQTLDKNAVLQQATSAIEADPDYQQLQSKALRVKNAYQNAFTYYLSSLVYEMNEDYNDAYIDCKTAHELRPSFAPAQTDLIRLAGLNGFSDEKEYWEQQFERTVEKQADIGHLVVVFQCGSVAQRKQIWIPIPIPGVGIQSVAFPIYRPVPYSAGSVGIVEGGTSLGQTEVLTDMDALAIRNFNDRIPELVLRTALRFAVKAVATYQMKKEMGLAGAVIGSALTAITEQADLRSWLLMPSNLQATRIPLKQGTHNLKLILHDRQGHTLDSREVEITIEPERFVLINLRGIENIVGKIQIASSL